MKIEKIRFYYPELCDGMSKNLFIFGDNMERFGKGGQAIIRDCKNAMGICTKISVEEYFSDKDYFKNLKIIQDDIFAIKHRYYRDNFNSIIFPEDGLGVGLAALHIKAPKTFMYLTLSLLDNFNFNNLQNLKTQKNEQI